MNKFFLFAIAFIIVLGTFGCGGGGANTSAVPECSAGGDTPTAAYKRLFAAVKSKDTNAIMAELTQSSIELGQMTAERYKKTLDQAYENGFTATTFAPTLPDIRDERINCNMGAIEVWSAKEQRWEDLPYMIEGGKWKLAYGDAFRGGYKSPGKGAAMREAEAANASRGNAIVPLSNTNARTNRTANVTLSNSNNGRSK